ncbi:MAG: hypothetical protein HYY34_01855 [Chloroflexi bacterium]|nr:hypothetical protein [Chloroflexota bacterium]
MAQKDGQPEVWRVAVWAFRDLERAFEDPVLALFRPVLRAEGLFGLVIELPLVDVSVFGGLERADLSLVDTGTAQQAEATRRLRPRLAGTAQPAGRSRLPLETRAVSARTETARVALAAPGRPDRRVDVTPVPVFSLRPGASARSDEQRPETLRTRSSLSATSEERARAPRARGETGVEGVGEIDRVRANEEAGQTGGREEIGLSISYFNRLVDHLLHETPGPESGGPRGAVSDASSARLARSDAERSASGEGGSAPVREQSPHRDHNEGLAAPPRPARERVVTASGGAPAEIRDGMSLVDALATDLLSKPVMPVWPLPEHSEPGRGFAGEVLLNTVDQAGGAGGGPSEGRPHRERQAPEARTGERAVGGFLMPADGSESAPYGTTDTDVVVSLVTDALVEQARRNGVDLS